MSVSLRDGVVTALDSGDRSLATTVLAEHEVQLVDVISLQNRVRRVTHAAGDVNADVLLQNRLQLLVHVTTLDDQLVLSIERTLRSKFAEDKTQDVLVITIHTVAVIHEIDPASLRCSNTGDLRHRHGVLLRCRQLRVILLDLLIHAIQNLRVTSFSKRVHRYNGDTGLQQSPPSYGPNRPCARLPPSPFLRQPLSSLTFS